MASRSGGGVDKMPKLEQIKPRQTGTLQSVLVGDAPKNSVAIEDVRFKRPR